MGRSDLAERDLLRAFPERQPAELLQLLLALEDPRSDGATVHTDSQLLVGHLTKAWKVNAANLRPLHARAADLLSRKHATLVWIPRGQNRAGKVLEKSK